MERERELSALSFATGLLLGGVIGAGVALLTTPQSGRRTRRTIRRSARRLRGGAQLRLDELGADLKDKVDEAIGAARDKLSG